MSRKKRYSARKFESVGESFTDLNGIKRKDTSANIYESMLLSPAYKDLKPRQQQLYVLCKAQFFGKRKPGQDYEDLVDTDLFYLNWGNMKHYGLYSENMKKEFYTDMKILIAHGFIELVAKGGSGKKKSIYRYSDHWKQWPFF